MESENITTGAPGQASPEEIRDFRNAISDMDSLSQSAFDEIIGVARLALNSLEHVDENWNPEDLARVLGVIWGVAEQAKEGIYNLARSAGCGSTDEAGLRRINAWYNYRESLETRGRVPPDR